MPVVGPGWGLDMLDNGQDSVETAEVGGENETVGTSTDALVDDKWAQMSV
jgi:hypothetical protein